MTFGPRSPSAASPPRGRDISGPTAPSQRSRRTNVPLSAHNRHTARGRRVADLAGAYAAALGSPDDVGLQAQIVGAAELQVIAEETRAAALANPGSIDLDAIVRLENAAHRAVTRLGIKPGAPPAPKTPTIEDYKARKAAERAQREGS